ncbi:MAG: LPXTG cell wall anchor domain-containing protein [Bacilli bacterium]
MVKYYESAYMSATLVGTKTYNVEVSGATKNTVVVDEKGNIGTTMNSSERFKVRVPATEVSKKLDVNVKFSASGTIQKAKLYKPSDNTYQRVTGLYDEAVPLTKTVSLSVSPKQRVCEVVGDKYYGKNGTEVDKKTYEKECKNSCEYIDGKYYGKAGNVVDEKTYKEECEPVRSCEFTDDKYYGKDGNEVDKATFDKECGEEVIVPNTSSNVSTLGIVGGMMLLASGAGIIAYRRKQLF